MLYQEDDFATRWRHLPIGSFKYPPHKRIGDWISDIHNLFSDHVFKPHLGHTFHTLFKGVLHLWALFLKTLCIFSKNKATSDKVSYGSGQKCSKELENYNFTSVETIVVKLQ